MTDDDEPLSDLVAEVDDEEEAADQERMEELAADAADAQREFRGATDDVRDAVGPTDGGDGVPEEEDPGPLSDVSREVRRRRERDRGDDDALFEEAFEAAADDADDDAVWESLEGDDVGGTVQGAATDSERDVRVVDKREFCERCQFFSAPPDVACEYDGSDILEMEGTDRFEVADCPIVRGEENLGDPG